MKIALEITVLVSTFLVISAYFYLSRSLPIVSGQVELPGVSEQVKVTRDKSGIPHIYGTNRIDAFYSFGFVMASERLFQMDLLRRAANGTLSEIFGKRLLSSDIRSRTVRFRATMEENLRLNRDKMDSRMLEELDAFYEGVNYYIKTQPLPFEFDFLGYRPSDFTLLDGLAFIGYMALNFSPSIEMDAFYSKLKSQFPPKLIEELRSFPSYKSNKTMMAALKGDIKSPNDLKIDNFNLDGYLEFEGSNSWVLAGSRTKSGLPILANDPHIGFTNPGILFEAHLDTPDYKIYGHYLPLIPYPPFGHNLNYGWGVTMSKVDSTDLYREKADLDKKLVKYKNKWVPLNYYKEEIKIRGEKENHSIDIYVTPHGPLLNNIVSGDTLSLKWSFYHPDNLPLKTFYRIGVAKNMKEFKEALAFGAAPGLNISYADIDGNIGWWVYGKIPIRKGHVKSEFILDGTSGKDEYLGYKSFEENPHIENPLSGVIISTNHIPPHNNSGVDGFYSPSDRYETISSELAKKEKWDLEGLKKLQTSPSNHVTNSILPLLLSVIEKEKFLKDSLEERARTHLRNWDKLSDVKSVGATIYHYWNLENLKLLLDEMSSSQQNKYCSFDSHWYFYKRQLKNSTSQWWDILETKNIRETRDEIVRKGFFAAVNNLEKELGKNPIKWEWGRLNTVEFYHPFGKIPPLNYFMNIGPYATGGGYNQINQMRGRGIDKRFKVVIGPATRRLIDFKNPKLSWGILPTGNSGHRLSDHYDDQLADFLQGDYRRQLMDEAIIEKEKENELIFIRKK